MTENIGGVLFTAGVIVFLFLAPVLWYVGAYIWMRLEDCFDGFLRWWRGYEYEYRPKH